LAVKTLFEQPLRFYLILYNLRTMKKAFEELKLYLKRKKAFIKSKEFVSKLYNFS